MSLRFEVRQDRAGQWSIQLPRALPLGQAIRMARSLAREHHERTGDGASVELVGVDTTTLLAQYAKPASGSESDPVSACA